jgi:four helix bundle protein
MLGFQRLDVYRSSVRFLAASVTLAQRVPRRHSVLAEQLRRAALSVPLRIAEGSARPDREAMRSYLSARTSALECAAVVDAIEALGLVQPNEVGEARELLEHVVTTLMRLRP